VRVAFLILLITGCAAVRSGPPVSQRELLTKALSAFIASAPQPSSPSLWLTNEDDTDCDRPEGVVRAPAVMHPLDGLAYEVFENHIVTLHWAKVIESHRHNYARDLKPETRKTLVLKELSSTVEDLCFLDEAKKRNADKVLVYQVIGEAPGSVMVHFRLSDARSGAIESSRTFLTTESAIVDRSSR